MPLKILVVLGITILIVLLSLKRPAFGLYFYLALTFMRPQDDRPNLADLHIPYIMLLTLAVLYLLKLKKTHRLFPDTKIFKPFVLFFIFMSISAMLADSTVISMDQWKIFVINFATFIYIYAFIQDEKDLKETLTVIAFCGLYFVYLAIFKGSDCIETQDGLGCGRRNFVKINQNFGQPNYLGLSMAVMFFITISLLYVYKRKLIKLAIIITLLLFVFILIKTNSRGAAVAFAVAIMFYIWKQPNSIRNFIILLFVGIISLAFIPDEFVDRLMTLREIEEDKSSMDRLVLWDKGFDLIVSNPIFGVGIGNFTLHAPNTPHNAYLQVASEMGMLALFTWLWLLFSSLNESRKIYLSKLDVSPFIKYVSLCLYIALFATMVQSMTTGLAHREFLYIVLALIAVTGKIYRRSIESQETKIHLKSTPNS